jgi:hypothetical protein
LLFPPMSTIVSSVVEMFFTIVDACFGWAYMFVALCA